MRRRWNGCAGALSEQAGMEDEKVPILTVHKMTQKQVLKEMQGLGVRHVQTLSHLPWQHVIIFQKVAEKQNP
jgi:hypothetical protein